MPNWLQQEVQGGIDMSVKDDILRQEELQKVEQGRNTRIQPIPQVQTAVQPTSYITPGTSQGNDAVKRMWDFVDSFKPDEEKIKAEDKKQRQRALISAIGDGISAIANLYYTSKGAPSMFNPTKSLSAQNNKRWEAIKKEREDNKDKYNNAYMRALQLQDAHNKSERQLQNTITQQNIAQAWRERQAAVAEEKAKQQQENWQKTFDANEKHRRAIEANYNNRNNSKNKKFTVGFNEKTYDKDSWGLREAANDALELYPDLYPTEANGRKKQRKDNLTTDDLHNIINKANERKKQDTVKEIYPLREIYEFGKSIAEERKNTNNPFRNNNSKNSASW